MRRKGGRTWIEINKEKTGPPLQPDRGQAEIGFVEADPFLHLGGCAQKRAVQRVQPRMIGANEVLPIARAARHKTAAMPARVGESAGTTIPAAHQQDRCATDLDRQIVAGFGDLLFACDAQPLAAEDAFDFPVEEFRGDITPTRQVPGLVHRSAYIA